MATAEANLVAFECALDQRQLKYSELEGSDRPALKICYNLNNISSLDVFFWFDLDGESVHWRTGPVARIPKEKVGCALQAINDANAHFRWLTFHIDADYDVICSGDAMLLPDVVGDLCHRLLTITLDIADDAFPKLMRALWAS